MIGSIDCRCSLIYFSSNNTSAGVFQTKAPPVPELTDFLCRSLIVERCRAPVPRTPASDQLPSTSFITPTPSMYVLLEISHSESCMTRLNPLYRKVTKAKYFLKYIRRSLVYYFTWIYKIFFNLYTQHYNNDTKLI